MSGFLLRSMGLTILVIGLVFRLPGLFVDTLGGLLIAALLIGLANAVLRPLFVKHRWPMHWVWLGSAIWMVNGIVSILIIQVLPGFRVVNVVQALAALLILTVCSTALTKVVQDR